MSTVCPPVPLPLTQVVADSQGNAAAATKQPSPPNGDYSGEIAHRFLTLTTAVHQLVLDEARQNLADGSKLLSYVAEAWLDERGLVTVDAQNPLRLVVPCRQRASGRREKPGRPLTKSGLAGLAATLATVIRAERVVVQVSEETGARTPGVTLEGEDYLRGHEIEEIAAVFEIPRLQLLVIETISSGGRLRAAAHYPVSGRKILAAPLVFGRGVDSELLAGHARKVCVDAMERREEKLGVCELRGCRIPPRKQLH